MFHVANRATDTEDSIIDVNKCIGCSDCTVACPSGAISMVPYEYPKQQVKEKEVIVALNHLVHSKSKQHAFLSGVYAGD